MRPLVVLVPACTLLFACTRSAPAPEYFPLDPGLRWDYAVHEHSKLTDRVSRLSLRNLDPVTRENHLYSRRLASDGNEYWLAQAGPALQRVGVRTAIDFEPRMDAAPRTVLQLPISAGQWWLVETRPYILERAEPFRERFSQDDSKRIELRMQVTALDEVVEVPAGRFEHCLKLEGSGLLNVLADARIGASDVPVTHIEWYAPGVGLVKLLRTETLDTQQIVGGTVEMQLTDFRR